MSKWKQFSSAISPSGVLTMIYDDAHAVLLNEGSTKITRASHVEPCMTGPGWTADMSPVGGPVLGPFALRQEALDAEVKYLEKLLF